MSNPPHDMSPEALHSAGATVRHESPFSLIEVPVATAGLPSAFIEKWVRPFYMLNLGDESRARAAFAPLAHEVDAQLVGVLLSQFDWRPRLAAAYLAAVYRPQSCEDHIGRLLLRSDLCYAGRGYCLALASFNNAAARSYLCRYLDYHLTQEDLWFDQGDALAAVACLDDVNRTSERQRYDAAWTRFVRNKPNFDLDRTRSAFARDLGAFQSLAVSLAG